MPQDASNATKVRLDPRQLGPGQLAVLQFSVLVLGLCGIVYELVIATVSTYLLGDSVYQFSITIGLFMFAMGVGSYVSRYLRGDLVTWFVLTEIVVALVGGVSSVALFVVFPFTAFYHVVMYGLIVAIGTLVGLEIPLLTRVLTEEKNLRRSIANVLSLDYLGALVGSVAFPLVLLPLLGLFRASFSIGLVNVLVALVNVAVFARILKRPGLLGAAAIAVVVLLLASMLGASAIQAFAEGQLYSEQIVYREQTPYQRIIVTRDEATGRHRLFLDGHVQFAEVDEYRYHEALVHPLMGLPGSRARVLILGGGDGLAAREVLKYDDVERIDLVDIDPAMTRICSSFAPIRRLNNDALRHDKVHIHNQDAWKFVRETGQRFDRVLLDFPDPHSESLNRLYSVEFYRLLRRCLADDGRFVTQSSSPLITRGVFWSIAATVRAANLESFSYQVQVPSFGGWGFTLAARGPLPDRYPIEAPTRFLTEELMAQASVFGKDEGPIRGHVNSIFEPTLYRTYNNEVSRW